MRIILCQEIVACFEIIFDPVEEMLVFDTMIRKLPKYPLRRIRAYVNLKIT